MEQGKETQEHGKRVKGRVRIDNNEEKVKEEEKETKQKKKVGEIRHCAERKRKEAAEDKIKKEKEPK